MNLKREYPVLVGKFQAIAPKTTMEDAMAAAIEMGCHLITVQRYIRGEVAKERFGQRLLSFLESRIEERENAHANG